MILFGLAIYSEMRFRVCFSISVGWSPIGTYRIEISPRPSAETTQPLYLSQTWQINQREAQHMRRVYFEIYGLSIDALVISCDSGCLVLNFPLDILEFGEAAIR